MGNSEQAPNSVFWNIHLFGMANDSTGIVFRPQTRRWLYGENWFTTQDETPSLSKTCLPTFPLITDRDF
jgi:hypothetical protein